MGVPSFAVDPRIVEEIEGNAQMRSEQGSGWMRQYGGPSAYTALARLPDNEKNVFFSVLGGQTDLSMIEIETGLSEKEVGKAIGALKRQGLVVDTGVGQVQTSAT